MQTIETPQENGGSLGDRLAGLIHLHHRRDLKPHRVIVIANPAAGQEQPILKTLNNVFKAADIQWDLDITHDSGDGQRLARKAVMAGADVVAVYGGDGTVVDVASGLVGSPVPLGILPGGTANMMSRALGIPQNLEAAAALIASADHTDYGIYIGQAGTRYFAQVVGVGVEAKIVEGADRAAKDKYGFIAYIIAGLRALTELRQTKFHLEMDGGRIEDVEGITCLIAKTGNLGIPGLEKASFTADPDAPMMDVAIIRQVNIPSIVSLASTMVSGGEKPPEILHWQAGEVRVTTDPPEIVQADGELLDERTPVVVRILPEPVHVIVPSDVAQKKQKQEDAA